MARFATRSAPSAGDDTGSRGKPNQLPSGEEFVFKVGDAIVARSDSDPVFPSDDYASWQAFLPDAYNDPDDATYSPRDHRAWVSDIKLENRWDEKPQPGSSYSILTYQGAKLPTWKMSFQAWDADGMNSLRIISKIIRPEPSYLGRSVPKVIRVTHGALAWWNVKDMVVRNVQGPSFDQKDGILEITCDCQQWVKPIPVKAQPQTPDNENVNPNVAGEKDDFGLQAEIDAQLRGPKDKNPVPISNEQDRAASAQAEREAARTRNSKPRRPGAVKGGSWL